MSKISIIGRWFIGLFLFLFIGTISITITFLIKPEYFIYDIEAFIKDRLPFLKVEEFSRV